MNEDSILKKIRRWCEPTQIASTKLGVGDDAAVIETAGGLVTFASDLSIENLHFDLNFSSPSDVGYKAVARVLSDLAAMGAAPLAVTLSIALPTKYSATENERWLELFFQGAVAIALETRTTLAGGDLSRIDGPVVIDAAAIGELPRDRTGWTRSGAQTRDRLFVTGPLGGAAFALEEFVTGRVTRLSPTQRAKHLRPRPRLDVGAVFSAYQATAIHAAMDISDGLIADAYRMCEASGVSLVISQQEIPLAPQASLVHALAGGDDYELMLALTEESIGTSAEALHQTGAVQIGTFESSRETGISEIFLKLPTGELKLIAAPSIDRHGHDPFRDVATQNPRRPCGGG